MKSISIKELAHIILNADTEYDAQELLKSLLIEILAKAESMETARDVRRILKSYILNIK